MLIPRGSAGGDNLTLYLEVLTLFHIYLAFSNIDSSLVHSAVLCFHAPNTYTEGKVELDGFLSTISMDSNR